MDLKKPARALRALPGYFWAGLLVRILVAPFLLQWFHPDERQMLEFAHFHAHGRLHPFMESQLHLRNQTLPWLLSYVIRACDGVGLSSPWAYLSAFHVLIGLWSWLGLMALIKYFKETFPGHPETARALGWIFALFWGFPFLYSRQLLEAVSAPSTYFLLLAVSRWQPLRAGFWAGVTTFLRYPSALWAFGGAIAALFVPATRRSRPWARSIALAALSCLVAIAIGGLADWSTYGEFLRSAPAYWDFNRPHGPVEKMFGNDSLWVYWRWFEFLLTPWLAPLFIALAAYALFRSPFLAAFCIPYLLAHFWTPHREPRFMLPLTPILFLVIAEAHARGQLRFLSNSWRHASRPVRGALVTMLMLHLGINFAWFPMNAWAQWKSAQGTLIRYYQELGRVPTHLIVKADPVIDALVPVDVRWADTDCQWHRPPLPAPHPRWLLYASEAPKECVKISAGNVPDFGPLVLKRLLRVRTGDLWRCPDTALVAICPEGFRDAAPDEPWTFDHL